MATASGFVFRVVHWLTRIDAPSVFVAMIALTAMLVAAVAIVDLREPASEPVLTAPLRWLTGRC